MVTRRYLKDYRIDDKLNARGKLRADAIYIGGDYRFIDPEAASSGKRYAILIMNVLSWSAFVGALVPQSSASHTMYCVLPLVASVLALFYESMAVYALMTLKEPMRHEQSDKLTVRLPLSSIASAVLSAAALIGFIVHGALSPALLVPGDTVFAVLSGVLAVLSAVIFILSRSFRAAKCTA